MFCIYCGNKNNDSDLFCFSCGKPLPEVTITTINSDKSTVTSKRYFKKKWLIIFIGIPFIAIIWFCNQIKFGNRTNNTQAINYNNTTPIINEKKFNTSYSSIDGYRTFVTTIPRHDCKIIVTPDISAYRHFKSKFNNMFGSSTNTNAIVINFDTWQDQNRKNIYLAINKNDVILIHSRSDIYAMGIDIVVNLLNDLNSSKK